MKVIALLQARTDSTRLPKKVLKTILDKPMIIHQLERTKESKLIDKGIVVTSTEESDNELSNTLKKHKYEVYRGNKNNVLKRFVDCLKQLNLDDEDVIVRLTGDCPLHDAKIIDESIQAFIDSDFDYLANCVNPIYPDGLDVEVFNYKSICHAYKYATKKSDLEHVTPYIRNHIQFKVSNLEKDDYYSHLRLTVDEEKDFELVEKIYDHFNKSIFSLKETISFLNENNHFIEINNNIQRNEGYEKSLKDDTYE